MKKDALLKGKARWIFMLVLLPGILGLAGSTLAVEAKLEKKDVQTLSNKGDYSPYVKRTYATDVFWGDTHLHTSYSVDAGLAGNYRLGPEDAYKFARGEKIISTGGMAVRLSRPLDFLVVSDHAEYLGLAPKILASDPQVLATEYGKRWHDLFKGGPEQAFTPIFEAVMSMMQRDEKIKDPGRRQSAWKYITNAADKYNDPGKFTALIGFEWTSMPGPGNNLHRVVIFKDDGQKASQVLPFSLFDSEDPEDLWHYMDNYEKKTGGHILAIPHNANLSNGLMFALEDFKGNPITREYAEKRIRWEPLAEVTQMKGDAETHPFLSPNDEFADYETWDKGNLFQIAPKDKSMLQYEYTRSALKLGLLMEQKVGINPYKFGMIGSTDSHTSLATAQENNFWAKATGMEPSAERYNHALFKSKTDEKLTTYSWQIVASGLAAVWAQENTRDSLFEAMQRKETYASTGPRMTVRFFGGWNFKTEDADSPNLAEKGYSNGIPMGGDLPAAPKLGEGGTKAPKDHAPTFLVGALKDPIGANLDRIQIIKGWADKNGELHEKVYNVALSDGRKVDSDGKVKPVGNTVDVKNATYTNTIGDAELRAVWEDPEFDAGQGACYYARVIEIPTPRWTAFDAKYFGIEMPEDVLMTSQERAYTSPIWYSPDGK